MSEIPKKVKDHVKSIITSFNAKTFKKADCYYKERFKGMYLYLDRCDNGRIRPICRLKYNGEMDDWDFAIFKWSSERYDAHEMFFPGAGHVNGTVEGGMKAGLKAYPMSEMDEQNELSSIIKKMFGI